MSSTTTTVLGSEVPSIEEEVLLHQLDLRASSAHSDKRKSLLEGPRVHHLGHVERFAHLCQVCGKTNYMGTLKLTNI